MLQNFSGKQWTDIITDGIEETKEKRVLAYLTWEREVDQRFVIVPSATVQELAPHIGDADAILQFETGRKQLAVASALAARLTYLATEPGIRESMVQCRKIEENISLDGQACLMVIQNCLSASIRTLYDQETPKELWAALARVYIITTGSNKQFLSDKFSACALGAKTISEFHAEVNAIAQERRIIGVTRKISLCKFSRGCRVITKIFGMQSSMQMI